MEYINGSKKYLHSTIDLSVLPFIFVGKIREGKSKWLNLYGLNPSLSPEMFFKWAQLSRKCFKHKNVDFIV